MALDRLLTIPTQADTVWSKEMGEIRKRGFVCLFVCLACYNGCLKREGEMEGEMDADRQRERERGTDEWQ